MPNPKSRAASFKVIAVVDTVELNGTWSKRDIEELVGTHYNYEDWLKR